MRHRPSGTVRTRMLRRPQGVVSIPSPSSSAAPPPPLSAASVPGEKKVVGPRTLSSKPRSWGDCSEGVSVFGPMVTCTGFFPEGGAVACSDGVFTLHGESGSFSSLSKTGNNGVSYFECKIVTLPAGAAVAIGITRVPLQQNDMPGWSTGCVALHSDDGSIFAGSRSHASAKACEALSEGDVVGVSCLDSGQVTFHVNGNIVHLHNAFSDTLPCHVAPCVGLDKKGTRVVANFGPIFEKHNEKFEDADKMEMELPRQAPRMLQRCSGR